MEVNIGKSARAGNPSMGRNRDLTFVEPWEREDQAVADFREQQEDASEISTRHLSPLETGRARPTRLSCGLLIHML